MPLSIAAMVAEMHKLRDELEHDVVGAAADDLSAIFDKAEVQLATQQKLFDLLLTDPAGRIQNIPENLEHVSVYFRDVVTPQIDQWVVGPGKAWAEKTVPIMHGAGRRLASVNLDVGSKLSPELVKAAFDNVSIAEQGILKVGYTSGYQIMNTVGDDVATWFQSTMNDAAIEGIPVTHHNPNVDSLESRLFKSGRIQPLTIKGKNGATYTRSIKQRAQAIARIESTRIINRTHEQLAEDAIGEEAVFRNSNPQDSRSTDVCEFASQQKAMSLEEWDNSTYGRPPRLSPFHLCRSVLIGGKAEWFDEVPEGDLQGAGLAATLKTPTAKKTPRQARAETSSAAAQAALQQAAVETAQKIAASAEAAKAAAKAKKTTDLFNLGTKVADDIPVAAQAHFDELLTKKQMTFAPEVPTTADQAAYLKLAEELEFPLDPITAKWQKAYTDHWDSAILKAQKPLLDAFDDYLPEAQTSWKIQVKKGAFAKMSESGLFAEAQLKARAGEILNLQKTQILEYEVLAAEAFQAQDQHKLDLIHHNLEKIPLAEAAAAELKVKGLIDNLEAKLSVGSKIAEYEELLDGLALGKFGPKKTITTKKQVKKLGDEIAELSTGEHTYFPSDIAKALQTAEDKLATAYPAEVVAFAEEYQKVVTSKKIPLADAAVIFDKYKSGALKGKASAKAKQAADAVKAKLDVTSPAAAVPDAPAPAPPPQTRWRR